MPVFTRGDVSIHYVESGSGYPVLLFAPGLMRSSADRWDHTDLKPREVLSEGYRVIAMDQRNAGKSSAPIKPTDGWQVYAEDAIGLMDHLGLNAINRGHYMYGFYQWAEELPAGTFKEPVSIDAACASFCENMFGGDFVFSVKRDFARTLQTPTLVLPGRDLAHPQEVAVETAELAPNAEMRMGWQDDLPAAGTAVRAFLAKNSG
jgi:hypothetical protein